MLETEEDAAVLRILLAQAESEDSAIERFGRSISATRNKTCPIRLSVIALSQDARSIH
jgi:hypothetical protein